MDEFVLGNVVVFTVTYDAEPISSAVTVSYVDDTHARQVSSPIAMTPSTGGLTWTAEWDSDTAGAGPGQVDWHAQSDDPHSAFDGSFMLTANKANTA